MAANEQISKKASGFVMPLFVFNFSLLQFIQMAVATYYVGIMRTLERRFGLQSTTTGLIMSVNDVVHISLVIFVGYYGQTGHKPRMISVTAMFFVVGSILMASPYFIYGAETLVADASFSNVTAVSETYAVEYCQANNTVDCSIVASADNADTVVALLMIGSMFNGVGGVAIQTLGMAYVDENSEKSKSSLYLGIVTSTYGLGPIAGFVLAMVCTKLPEDLSGTYSTPPGDPRMIGAWWLGYVVCSVVIFISALPVFFFPKEIAAETSVVELKELQNKTPTAVVAKKSLLIQVKEFPKSLLILLSNKSFICYMGMMMFLFYVIPGFYMQVPKYIEAHFRQPAFVSNIAASVPAFSSVLGAFFGGMIMSKTRMGSAGGVKMLIWSTAVALVGLIGVMFIVCPEVHLNGAVESDGSFNMVLPCNSNCSCNVGKSSNEPVCGQDGRSYFSPCFAGCTHGYLSDNQTGQMYNGCACVQEAVDTAQTISGYCEAPCHTQFYIFVVATFVVSFLISVGRVPSTIIQFRVVGKKEGAFALGVSSFVFNLLVFIPGPILFGAIIDSTCLVFDTTCSRSGACLMFDTSDFRIRTYGLTSVFMAISIIWMVCLLLSLRRAESEQSVNSVNDTEEDMDIRQETTVAVEA